MSLSAIRDELAAILFTLPPVTVSTPHGDTTISLNQSLAYEPEMAPEVVPCAWLGDSVGDGELGGFEVWTHTLPVTVIVHEAGSAEMERRTVETFQEAIQAHMRGHVQLNQTCMACLFTHYEQGTVTFQGKPYRGITFTALIEEKVEAVNEYSP